MINKMFGGTLTGVAVLAVFAGALLAPAAQATPITFYNDAGTHSVQRFTINCGSATGDCAGLLQAANADGPLSWSPTVGQMFAGPGKSGDKFIGNWTSNLVDASLTNAVKKDGGGKQELAFTIDGDYFLIKLGNKGGLPYAVLQNLSGGPLDLWFAATRGTGSGLSHYISYTDPAPPPTPVSVPEPGVLGMFGAGLLIAGVGYGMRRRRT